MDARRKLNSANMIGILLIAGLIGGLTGSWPAFWIAVIVLFIGACHAGDIRR